MTGFGPTTADGSVTLAALLEAAVDSDDVPNEGTLSALQSDHAPTDGRLGKVVAGNSTTWYLGDGNSWNEVGADVGLQSVTEAYRTDSLPSSPSEAGLFHDLDRGTVAWWDTDHYEFPSFVDDVTTSFTTVTNTTTRTTVFNPDINANSLIPGRTYRLELLGEFSTASSSDFFTIDVDLAGTDVAGVASTPANETRAPWNTVIQFSVHDAGSNVELHPHTRGLFANVPASARHDAVSTDPATATALSASVQWDAADPDNEVVVEHAYLEQMG